MTTKYLVIHIYKFYKIILMWFLEHLFILAITHIYIIQKFNKHVNQGKMPLARKPRCTSPGWPADWSRPVKLY